MSDEYSTRNRDNMLWVIVVAMMVVNVGVLMFSTTYGGNDVETAALSTEVENLGFQLNSAIQEIEALQDEVRISSLPDNTPNLGFIELYNTTRNSVVLIETDIGSGSGWIYDTNGHIITNNHVVENTNWIRVTFQSGTIIQATLVGRDPYSDMAVIKINASDEPLFPLEIGVSADLLVGETVTAIGNPFGLDNTMTAGIVSATGRQMSTINNYAIVDVIQTDAAINPGNSGGPLFNLKGKVVGMNTAIISSTSEFSGISFAIPSDTIQREVEALIENGSYEHPWLGVSGLNLAPQFAEAMGLINTTKGTLVVEILEGGPADIAGILDSSDTVIIGGFTYSIGGDVIIGINGVIMETFYELQVYLTRNTSPGDIVTMNVIRDGEVIEVPFTLGSRPPPT
ncbi:trypsin-like serine protease [Candidatus Bathyarchaeota archaeon]|nr:trypsin-like serine protease [Candidatus Bathyarchaeota archaeon]MBT4320924.1 trypsin-like serine protease [Candidatus Bathyarchaeota archaeon]MBT4423197.1 trypsin-like serine protease [Candidatus Bathyarchaeota archaeon]MBT6605940.1 trypsin-like serine protease [Candidatus Bathyarchaeota archaeon]MBT7187179.1 trypsin-like serine protease [Candidatus Bathyarchaeota archaeon]